MTKPAKKKAASNGHDLSEVTHVPEMVDVAPLKDHPDNYREHDDLQLDHIKQSAKTHGIYKNIVLGRGDVILAGHGMVKWARRDGVKKLPAVRLDIDPMSPRALKLVTGDNEISKLAMVDDRKLTDMLKKIKDLDPAGLVGTGFDETMLAALVMVTRPKSEVEGVDAAANWVGMPDYDPAGNVLKTIVTFRNPEDRNEFYRKLGLKLPSEPKNIMSTWWPAKERDAAAAMRFET